MTLAPLISSDSHIIEPPDLWTSRIDQVHATTAPHVVEAGGRAVVGVGAKRRLSFAGGAQTGDRFTKPHRVAHRRSLRAGAPGGYEPDEHLRDNATDGVVGSVLYPTEGLLLYTQADSALLSGLLSRLQRLPRRVLRLRPDRLKGVAMLNADDIDDAVRRDAARPQPRPVGRAHSHRRSIRAAVRLP